MINKNRPTASSWKTQESFQNHSKVRSLQYQPSAKDTERISFANGGMIEDLPNEDGLRVTMPSGESRVEPNYGFVMPYGMDEELFYRRDVEQSSFGIVFADDEAREWSQTFPEGGGTVLTQSGNQFGFRLITPELVITVDSSGKTESTYGHEAIQTDLVERDGRLVVRTMLDEITPPVPLEWLLASGEATS